MNDSDITARAERTTASCRIAALPGYSALAGVLDEALQQAQNGKGSERHAYPGENFEDQQIVQLGEWMGSTHFEVGQACKKSLESTRLPRLRARAELLGAINYLAAAVLILDRSQPACACGGGRKVNGIVDLADLGPEPPAVVEGVGFRQWCSARGQ